MKRIMRVAVAAAAAVIAACGPGMVRQAHAQRNVRPAWQHIETGIVALGPKMDYADALAAVARMSQLPDAGDTWIQWRRKLWIVPLWMHKEYFTKVHPLGAADSVPPPQNLRAAPH